MVKLKAPMIGQCTDREENEQSSAEDQRPAMGSEEKEKMHLHGWKDFY